MSVSSESCKSFQTLCLVDPLPVLLYRQIPLPRAGPRAGVCRSAPRSPQIPWGRGAKCRVAVLRLGATLPSVRPSVLRGAPVQRSPPVGESAERPLRACGRPLPAGRSVRGSVLRVGPAGPAVDAGPSRALVSVRPPLASSWAELRGSESGGRAGAGAQRAAAASAGAAREQNK